MPSSDSTLKGCNKYSSRITSPKAQGASQAMLMATGLKKEDLDKPQIGIASVWYEGNPCNMHLLKLSESVKKGVESVGLVGYRFNTVGVSDGISMGTEGMRYSLPSRDLIADSVETVMSAQWYDGCIAIPGCDKNMPGVIMGLTRINRPSLMIYGGSIQPGTGTNGDPLDIVSAFQAYGQYIAGTITEDQRSDIICNACPGPGACGGMYTANTMAIAIEALGMSLPFSSSAPATSVNKVSECEQACGVAISRLIERDIKPSDILTRRAFENAITTVMALGGSTNAVIHLLAMAATCAHSPISPPVSLSDFQAISDRTPQIADLKPSGKYVMTDVHRIGGTPAVLKHLMSEGLLHGDCLTVTGNTLEENLRSVLALDFTKQDVIHHVKKCSSCLKFGLTLKQLYHILQLRQHVFIVEQNCPYLDADDKDQDCLHVTGVDPDGSISAYTRLLPPGKCYTGYS
eukprot:GHVN01075977.1.p1 GENE.GHVN01075977.1~~GHVN01075977.1.p1  ORF type:complete len:528 (+),score=82.74 GHVN01075977.1:206-1585(+)